MTFVVREIDVTIALGQGDFGAGAAGNQNTVTLTGLQVSANVVKGGQPSLDTADIRIWGLTLSQMNTITRLGKPLDYPRNNTITLMAGDAVAGKSQVFTGTMMSAYADFESAPDVCVVISAIDNIIPLVKPVAPISFPNGADVGVIMNQIAASMGKGFLNDGVSVQLSRPYFAGTAMQQFRKCLEAANIWGITNGGPTQDMVEIWAKNTARGAMGPEIGPDSTLDGYPKYSDVGATIRALFNPGIQFGSAFTLKTSITPAAGTWYVLRLSYALESQLPNGRWFMDIDATRQAAAA